MNTETITITETLHPHFRHINYFGTSSIKRCDCNSKGYQIYFWGGFIDRKFYHIKNFCPKCYEKEVKINLLTVKKLNNCKFEIKGYRNEFLPEFLLALRDELNDITHQSSLF